MWVSFSIYYRLSKYYCGSPPKHSTENLTFLDHLFPKVLQHLWYNTGKWDSPQLMVLVLDFKNKIFILEPRETDTIWFLKNSLLHLTYAIYQGLSTCTRIKMKSNESKTAKNTILECIKKVIKINNCHNYKHTTSPSIFFYWEVGGKENFQIFIIRWIN